ncbi:MAG TPA: polysaccharide deacetylase family protein [Pyrinomonadaceae bacterium]|nr:polysaccharide deacetylase family protein [Pyrinomonadaceae bacterium]
MQRVLSGGVLVCLLLAAMPAACQAQTPAPPAPGGTRREVAVTFDDLPGMHPYSLATTRAINEKILAVIAEHKIPAVGFVTGARVNAGGEGGERLDILRRWLAAGLELGNHTYSHHDYHRTAAATFRQDVIRAEVIINKLLAERGARVKYFRHPYLHTGRSQAARDELAQFLAGRGYTVAPVTHDNQEWIFAIAYERASAVGDRALMRRIGEAYVVYMRDLFEYYERLSNDLFGYEIRQVLLLHVNPLNADYFDELVGMMRERGYEFVSLGRALEDKAYASADTYAGAMGLSWLQRWALARGTRYQKETPVPGFVMGVYQQRGAARGARR